MPRVQPLQALTAAFLVAGLALAPTATAQTWDPPFDTDGLDRSTPSNNAYLTGSFTWQNEEAAPFRPNRDQRAAFAARLHLQGPSGSCARLRIRTYVGDAFLNQGEYLEKEFPSYSADFGYFTFCRDDGTGSLDYTGADIQERSFTDIGYFKAAKVSVCWSRNRDTPPSGDCYNFTVHPGD